MQVRICPASLPPPIASKAMRRAGLDQRIGQIVHEGRRGGIDDMLRADLAQDLGLLGAAHDIDEGDAVLEADLVEHLPEIGGGRRMHQRLVAFAPHGLGHAERGQRIDEAGGAVGRRRACRQRQAVGRLEGAVLRIHRAADHRDGLAHQRLGRVRRSGPDDDAGALVADRHRFIEPSRHRPHRRFRHFRGDHGRILGAGRLGGGHIGGADQKPEVGRIDRRRLDADHDLVGAAVQASAPRPAIFRVRRSS